MCHISLSYDISSIYTSYIRTSYMNIFWWGNSYIFLIVLLYQYAYDMICVKKNFRCELSYIYFLLFFENQRVAFTP